MVVRPGTFPAGPSTASVGRARNRRAAARQIQIFGRIVPVKEMVAKIEAVRTEDVCRAAARLFRARPTLAVLGPAGKVPGLTTIAEKLAA
jgi:hypothetical protein